MLNKYLYAFAKDGIFRILSIVSVVGLALCAVVLRLNAAQVLQLKDIRAKQAVIAQIPDLKVKIANMARSVDGLVLNGIISGKASPMAVINNTLVKVGEEIGGKKVVDITTDVTVCEPPPSSKCVHLSLL